MDSPLPPPRPLASLPNALIMVGALVLAGLVLVVQLMLGSAYQAEMRVARAELDHRRPPPPSVPGALDQLEPTGTRPANASAPTEARRTAPDEIAMSRYAQTRRSVLTAAAGVTALILLITFLLYRQALELEASRRHARHTEMLYRAASEGSLDAVFMLRASRDALGGIDDFIFTDANRRGLRQLERNGEALIGARLTQRLTSLCASGYLDKCKAVVTARIGFEHEFQLLRPGAVEAGEWLHHQVVALEGDAIAIISRDITVQKQTAEQLDAMARLDPLTQLPNRRAFEERLVDATARARRSGKALTLVYLDLDGFKRVNDTLGHAAGDALLIEVAHRLKGCVRNTDQVSRLGGDEFTVILEESGTADDRLAQCERMLSALSRPHALAGHRVVVSTPSLGVAVYQPGEALEELRARADAAMYEAKRAGKACLRWAPSLAASTAVDARS